MTLKQKRDLYIYLMDKSKLVSSKRFYRDKIGKIEIKINNEELIKSLENGIMKLKENILHQLNCLEINEELLKDMIDIIISYKKELINCLDIRYEKQI